MKAPQFYIVTVAGFLCLALSIALVAISQSNQEIASQIESQQNELNQVNNARQALSNIARDVITAAPGNEKLQTILKQNGISIKE